MLIKFKSSRNWYARFMHNGQLYQKSLKTPNKRQAEKLAAQYKQDVINNLHNLDTKKISIRECFELYQQAKPNDKGLANAAGYFSKWVDEKVISVDRPITDITTAVLNKIVTVRQREGKKPATVRHTIGFVTRAIDHAKKHGYTITSAEIPAVKVKNHKLIWFTLDDEKKILKELNPTREIPKLPSHQKNPTHFRRLAMQDNYDFFIMLLDTGTRLQELAHLKWSDVNLQTGEIQLYRPKVNNQSVIHMTNRVCEILQRRSSTKQTDWVFTNAKQSDHKKTFNAIRSAIKRAGFTEATIHTCRHSYASRLVQAGVQLYDVSQILGHTSMSMTTRYAHLNKSEITKKAAAVLDGMVR
jgi:integrase